MRIYTFFHSSFLLPTPQPLTICLATATRLHNINIWNAFEIKFITINVLIFKFYDYNFISCGKGYQ